jgi:hypothetical protein
MTKEKVILPMAIRKDSIVTRSPCIKMHIFQIQKKKTPIQSDTVNIPHNPECSKKE